MLDLFTCQSTAADNFLWILKMFLEVSNGLKVRRSRDHRSLRSFGTFGTAMTFAAFQPNKTHSKGTLRDLFLQFNSRRWLRRATRIRTSEEASKYPIYWCPVDRSVAEAFIKETMVAAASLFRRAPKMPSIWKCSKSHFRWKKMTHRYEIINLKNIFSLIEIKNWYLSTIILHF